MRLLKQAKRALAVTCALAMTVTSIWVAPVTADAAPAEQKDVSTAVKEMRTTYGDSFQGTSLSTRSITTASGGSIEPSPDIYDPVPDELFTDEEILTIDEVKVATQGAIVSFLGQVTYKFCGFDGAEGEPNTVILQDVIDGNVTAMQVYQKGGVTDYNIGDVVKVSGKVGAYGGVPQVSDTTVECIRKEDKLFQPQVITISQIGDDYLSEYVTIKDVKLGSYAASDNTTLTDATGTTSIFKGAAFPEGVVEGDVVDVTGIASKYVKKDGSITLQLRVGSSDGYVKKAGSTEDEILYRIPVMETSDVHGFLLDVSSGNPATYQYRMARVADAVNDLRKDSTKGDVLLCDAGDIYQGNPVSNLLEGKSMIAAYDYMKYDAVALGNHEFDWSVTDLIDSDGTMGSYSISNSAGSVSGDSKIPVLAANIYKAGTDERVNFTQDYVIVEKEGQSADGKKKTFKIAVFGYVDDYSRDIMAAKIAPYEIREADLAKLEAKAADLEAAGTVDASVLLAHSDATSLSGKVATGSAFDLILGGHSHKNAAAGTEDTTGVPYVQTRNQAYAYGYADLCISSEGAVTVENASTQTVYSSATKANLYDTPENAANLDPEVIKISKMAVEAVAPIMNVELGTITEQVTKAPINGNPYSSTAGNYMTELMSAATGAKVSFTNNGGIRTEYTFEEASRTLTAGDVYTIAPFCNTLPTFNLTYDELIDLIEFTVSEEGKFLDLRMGGATAYYTDGKVTTLFVGDKLVYDKEAYQNGCKGSDTLLVCTNEYVATSAGTPFVGKTSNEAAKGESPLVDNEAYIAALKKEANANSGKIFINTAATLVAGEWDGKTIPTDNSSRFEGNSNGGGTSLPVIPGYSDPTTENKPADKKEETSLVEKENGNSYIEDKDGNILKGVFVEVDGKKYYTTKNTGKVVEDKIFKVSGNKYIAGKDGAIIRGKICEMDGAKYYATKGSGKLVVNKIFKLNGKKYVASASGKLVVKKWVTLADGRRVYCDENGVVTKIKK